MQLISTTIRDSISKQIDLHEAKRKPRATTSDCTPDLQTSTQLGNPPPQSFAPLSWSYFIEFHQPWNPDAFFRSPLVSTVLGRVFFLLSPFPGHYFPHPNTHFTCSFIFAPHSLFRRCLKVGKIDSQLNSGATKYDALCRPVFFTSLLFLEKSLSCLLSRATVSFPICKSQN